MAQYISSRADIVPDAFSDELSALQDAVPPSSLAEVRQSKQRAVVAPPLVYAFSSPRPHSLSTTTQPTHSVNIIAR